MADEKKPMTSFTRDVVHTPHPPPRILSHGIYTVAYENPSPPNWTSDIRGSIEQYFVSLTNFSYARRLLREIFFLAPGLLIGHICATLWLSISDALLLFCLGSVFNFVEGRSSGNVSQESLNIAIYGGLLCAIFGPACHRCLAYANDIISSRLKAHFLPQLIEASMRVDLSSMQDCYTIFPVKGHFPSDVPGASFLQGLSHIARTTAALSSQVVVLINAVLRKPSPEREVLFIFCIAHPLVRWLAPSDVTGTQGYVFYTLNVPFKRMRSLYNLAFSCQYREELILNGAANSIPSEYQKSTEQLGDEIVTEPFPWASGLIRRWYWDFLVNLTLDLPLVIYALALPCHLSPSSVMSIALLQQATNTLSLSIGEYGMNSGSIQNLCLQAKWLYDAISYKSKMSNGPMSYPDPSHGSSSDGMKISFRQISLRYDKCGHNALDDVSFEIAPGQLVLVVGVNGSGKSSLLKLIARLSNPTGGEILIDDNPLSTYDSDDVRASIAFLPQLPLLFPMSVKENICLGLPSRLHVTDEQIQEAAKMGSCTSWISKLQNGYDTQLKPTHDIGNGWADGTYGTVSDRLREKLARHEQQTVTISGGERQRLAAYEPCNYFRVIAAYFHRLIIRARTFMRINHTDIKLVVVDEATSSLDAITEHDILSEFHRVRKGKTMILVTHRFHHLVKEADQIICMKEGSVLERGTHNQLIKADGEYAKLYNAQVPSA
ncbi:P-loop containing nucleoside triphosphate hydrolase protein [Suillus paluster]|uniref:P-loop containing nucleoside triphosphate hydrolase protein n=1 Tax=Suillus paluster TaxID=48578 RepID=UPI001B86050B|nr:P-loop containing nucleoside triphosphate hydrolase protein [Suillus paluster]KAG1725716.1 P-loop containing nucleoside triphosphate hydrolase protein [Suillus paluster]